MDVVDDPSAAVGPSLTSLGSHSSGGGVLPLVHAEHAAAAAAALIQEELLPRLFPAGVEAPLPQSSEAGSAGFSTTAATAATAAATTVQVQQSVVVLPSTSQWPLSSEHDTMVYRRPPSSEYVTVSEASSCGGSGCSDRAVEERSIASSRQLLPPSIIGVSPGVVCCQSFLPLASDSITDRSSRRIELLLQLSSPLPEEGVTVLARYRDGFLDARFEPEADDRENNAVHVRVSTFPQSSSFPPECTTVLLPAVCPSFEISTRTHYNILYFLPLSNRQVSVQLPPSFCPVGLVYLDLMHSSTNLLGEQGRPLLLLPSEACVEEARCLCSGPLPQVSLGSLRAHSIDPQDHIRACGSSSSSSPSIRACGSSATPPFLLDLACWMEAAASSHISPSDGAALGEAGRSVNAPHSARPVLLITAGFKLLTHAVARGLPALSVSILDVLSTDMGLAPDNLIHSAPSAHDLGGGSGSGAVSEAPPSDLTLLHQAVMSRSMPVLHALLSWAVARSVRPNWMITAGASGVTPLHLAALLPNGGEAVRSLLGLPRPYGLDVAAAWLLYRSTSDGRTPAELGLSAGLPPSLATWAHDMLVKAAAEDTDDAGLAAPATGSMHSGPPVTLRSMSADSGTSGTAAVMASLSPTAGGAPPSDDEALKASSEAIGALPVEGRPSYGDHTGGSGVTAALKPEANGPPSPLIGVRPSPKPSTGRVLPVEEAGRFWRLCRLLLLGFPDRGAEQRYAQFKVHTGGETQRPPYIQMVIMESPGSTFST